MGQQQPTRATQAHPASGRPEWGLILDGDLPADHNMAKDAWLLERTRRTGRPVLRLYGWQGYALSLGRAQKPGRDLDLAACAAEGIPIVRRATGGRAVLHGADLTYSLCAPTTHPPFQGGIMPIYRTVAEALVAFMTRLGQAPSTQPYTGRERAARVSPICFATPSAHEVLVDGRKLVGSAQRLVSGAFLQHGSIPLKPQHALLGRLFVAATPEAAAAAMTDLESLGVLPGMSHDALREAFVAAFAETFAVRFTACWNDGDEAQVRARLADFAPLPFQDAGGEAPPSRAGVARSPGD